VQAMIDVKCANKSRRLKPHHRGNEHGRVEAAAERDGDTTRFSVLGNRCERALDLFENRFQTGVPMNVLRLVLA